LASYEFTLELSRDIIDSEAEIIKANCSDATIKNIPTGIDTGYTGTLVEFDRESESLEKAIESAMRDVEAVPDLHATGITIPAPERNESRAEETDSGHSSALAKPAQADSSADVEPDAKTEKKPSAKKASTRKPSTRKAGTRKAAAGRENANGQDNGAIGERGSVDPAEAR
jgi:hypothetical protein